MLSYCASVCVLAIRAKARRKHECLPLNIILLMFRVETTLVREGVETIMNIDKHYSTDVQSGDNSREGRSGDHHEH